MHLNSRAPASYASGTLRFRRYRSSPSYNKDYEENGSARHFPKFAPLRSANFS